RIEKGIGQLKGTQQNELETNRREMLAQIGELKNQYLKELNEDNEFKEALELYVKPRGTWRVSIINEKNEKEMNEKEGDVEKVVTDFLTSKNKLTSDDKESLENEANTFLCSQKSELLINKVNSFFTSENQLTLEDVNVLKVAANQFLALKDKKALKLLKIAINEYLESSKDERVLKNAICNFLESPYVLDKLSKENKLVLGQQVTIEDVKVLEKASKDKKDFEKTAKELLTLKAKEVLETAINKLLNLKRKKVLLLLGSGGTGKSTFNHHLARQLWNQYNQQEITQPIPLFIALAPLKALINQNKDFIEAYLQQAGNLTKDEINKLRERKFVFILDGYDEISERERQCYNSNLFSEWKNAKIIISCRPEYLDKGYEERFWPIENGERGFQELTLTPFSEIEIEQYIRKYFEYSKTKGSPLPSNADADTYLQQIKDMPQVKDLVSNPILLKITLAVLPNLPVIASQINRIMLYDEFIKKWFERAQNRLQKIQLKPKEQEEFDRLRNKDDFYKECLQFSKEFAFKMFTDNNEVIVSYDTINENIASGWAKFLGDTDEKCRLMRFSMPLFRRGNQYWFFHKSLRDFLISCALVDSFKDSSQTTLLNRQSIVPEPAIQDFLVERVQQIPEHVQSLSNFIEYSKLNDNIQIASANAITILSRAKIPLSKNLNNIRVSGADLNNGIFNNYQLARAKLDYVNFQNAKFQNANLQDSSFLNANLASADLTSASLQNANFRNANFQNATLQNTNLQYAKLPSSSLRYANFKGSNLSYKI
ncbi:45433_t:CDS:2, partial [Gigaspora margarita]